jgi:hypothetical protein
LTSIDELKGSFLNFSYFQPLIASKSINPYETMMQCFINGSAAFMEYNYPGIDFLIPLILRDGRMSFLGVQVKLRRDLAAEKKVFYEFYYSMRFSNMFPRLQSDRAHGLLILSLCDVEFSKLKLKIGQKKLENQAFVISEQDLINAKESKEKPKILNEEELPPALVVCGCSFKFGNEYNNDYQSDNKNNEELGGSSSDESYYLSDMSEREQSDRSEKENRAVYQTFFEKLVYVYSPRLNTVKGLEPKKFEELESLNSSITGKKIRRSKKTRSKSGDPSSSNNLS